MITPRTINEMLAKHWPAARCACTEVGAAHATAWFFCFGATGRIEPLALTSDLTIRFLRPARGETVFARAELNKLGRRSVVGSVTVWTEAPDAPSAIAQGTYVLPGATEDRP